MKEALEQIVLQMYRSSLQYSAAVREFQKTFLATVLREANANQVRAAKKLGIHRNPWRRQIQELKLDIKMLSVRDPVRGRIVSTYQPPADSRQRALRPRWLERIAGHPIHK